MRGCEPHDLSMIEVELASLQRVLTIFQFHAFPTALDLPTGIQLVAYYTAITRAPDKPQKLGQRN